MGTTATGAIDDFSTLSQLAREFNAWFHVDAAYGGFFALLDEVRSEIKGIEKADSLCVDAHKSLFLPAGTAMLIVRNKNHLSDLNQVQAHYLDRDESDARTASPKDPVDIVGSSHLAPLEMAKEALSGAAGNEPHWTSSIDYSPELSRYFRGLRVWFPLLFHGTNFFASLLREKLEIANALHKQLLRIPHVEVGEVPQLSVVFFRFIQDNAKRDDHNDNEVNKTVFSIVKKDGWVYFTTIELDGKVWLRIAILNYQSNWEHVQLALQLILEAHRTVVSMQPGRLHGGTVADGWTGAVLQ